MRLGQIARKVEVNPSDIVDFLLADGIEISNHPNTKVEQEILEKVLEKFGAVESDPPEEVETELLEIKIEEENVEEVLTEVVTEPVVNEIVEEIEELISDKPTLEETTVGEILSALEESIQEETEGSVDIATEISEKESVVIRAPKVELQGLKVVGKIELPEPKLIEEKEAVEPSENRVQKKIKKPAERSAKGNRREKRELTPEDIRNQKARSEKRQKARAIEKQKQKRKDHYNKNIKARQPKPATKSKESVVKKEIATVSIREPHKKVSLLGKVWKWMNT